MVPLVTPNPHNDKQPFKAMWGFAQKYGGNVGTGTNAPPPLTIMRQQYPVAIRQSDRILTLQGPPLGSIAPI